MISQSPISHISADGAVRPLEAHLQSVAEKAAEFAKSFDSECWAFLAGIWHDLGKYQENFQVRIRGEKSADAHLEAPELDEKAAPNQQYTNATHPKKPHSHAGAQWAMQTEQLGPKLGLILAYLITGHHTGLPDYDSDDQRSLNFRLHSVEFNEDEWKRATQQAPVLPVSHILQPKVLQELKQLCLANKSDTLPPAAHPNHNKLNGKPSWGGLALWVRMLFSCLVDADFLDTEAFLDPNRQLQRHNDIRLADLMPHFEAYMQVKIKNAVGSPLARVRQQVLKDCEAAAHHPPGFFSLTVPTGGGKTLSSLAFALGHAKVHNKSRIIYAIPFTSIIEQTAQVFREVFPGQSDSIIEHHSNLSDDENTTAQRLRAENWDAPLIVTTNVQLFESLFGARTSRCRKLHNITNSVIILDEAQQLPPDFLEPILKCLRLLVAHYGVTVVLCTATQPSLEERRSPVRPETITFRGLEANQVREIVQDSAALYTHPALARVCIRPLRSEAENPWTTPTDWPTVARNIVQHDEVLAIVGTRSGCRALFEEVRKLAKPEAQTLHLSGLMCAEHRSDVIGDIRTRLKNRRNGTETLPLFVVSTQLVEAGVDLDFSVVFRELAGLDSIAQAAGRCNREGKLPNGQLGQVYVFASEKPAAPGLLRTSQQTAENMMIRNPDIQILMPETFREYFDHYFGKLESESAAARQLDLFNILKMETDTAPSVPFREIAKKFKMIINEGVVVVVPYKPEVEKWLNLLEKNPAGGRFIYRKLQGFTANLHHSTAKQLLKAGSLYERAGLVVATPYAYDAVLGLKLDGEGYSTEELTW